MMGGSYQDALTVPMHIVSRYIQFADIEDLVREKEEKTKKETN